MLAHPERRRQFDSVDPYYLSLEEDTPIAANFKGPMANDDDYFFKMWAPVYEMEARFSKKTPVPLLGSFADPKDKVEAFYDFWYNFDSWRSYEYLDKEVNEGSDRLVLVSLISFAFVSVCRVIDRRRWNIAVMTSGTRKKRINRSALGEKRKIPPGCAALSISR